LWFGALLVFFKFQQICLLEAFIIITDLFLDNVTYKLYVVTIVIVKHFAKQKQPNLSELQSGAENWMSGTLRNRNGAGSGVGK